MIATTQRGCIKIATDARIATVFPGSLASAARLEAGREPRSPFVGRCLHAYLTYVQRARVAVTSLVRPTAHCLHR